jgi:hypothetical protein
METIASMNSDSPDAASAHITPKNPSPPHDRPTNDRRRALRHKILTPAYANRSGSSQGAVLELSEILNLSESGMCIQAPSQLKVDRLLPLGIELAESGEQIRTVGHVAWSEPSGKTGVRFPEMAEGLHLQLRHWLAANARPQRTSTSDQVSSRAEWDKLQNRADVLSFPAPDSPTDDSTPSSTDPMPSSNEDPELGPPPAKLRRGIIFLLTALLLLGGAIWLGARWMIATKMTATKNASTTTAALPSSTSPPSVSTETYIGADLKDLQIHADAGDAAAEYRLGMRYATGEDVTQDYSEAMRWFLRAADHGNLHAQATVAAWMLAGRGAPQDYSQAYYWALLAQAGGDESGRVIVLNSAPYLSPAQTAAAQKQADDWLHTHHIGHAPSETSQ